MKKTFLSFCLISLCAAHSALALSVEEFKRFIGRYEGIKSSWNADASEQSCVVEVSLNRSNLVVVTLTDENGTPLYIRKEGQDNFETIFLHQMTHPKVFLSTFLKEGYGDIGDFSHYIENLGWTTTERWRLRFLNMDRPSAAIQITYRKSNRWIPFDSTIAYTSDLHGCYNLRRIQ